MLKRFIKLGFKRRIKILDDRLPTDIAVFDRVKLSFHIGSKLNINYIAEIIFHQLRYNKTKLGRYELLLLSQNISPINNC